MNLYATLKKNGNNNGDGLLTDPDGLLSSKIFDPRNPWQMGQIKLACPIVHPMAKHLGSKHNPEEYMIDQIAVLPVYFRNERLGFSKDFQDDLNILYRNILQKNTQLKTILDDEKAKLSFETRLKE